MGSLGIGEWACCRLGDRSKPLAELDSVSEFSLASMTVRRYRDSFFCMFEWTVLCKENEDRKVMQEMKNSVLWLL